MIEQIPNDLGKTRRTVAEQVADCKALTFGSSAMWTREGLN